MSGPDRDQQKQSQTVDVDVADKSPRAGGDSATDLTHKLDSGEAARKVKAILKGEGGVPAHLPQLFTSLDDAAKKDYLTSHFSELKKMPGDVALEVAQILRGDANAVITAALDGHPPASIQVLRAYLLAIGTPLGSITGPTFTKLKSTVGAPLMTLIPSVGIRLVEIESHAGFLEWFIESTDARVAGTAMAKSLTREMATTCDAHQLWSWVDHIRAADVDDRVAGITPSITDAHAKTTLEALLGPRKGLTEDQLLELHGEHVNDVHAGLAGKHTVESLLDAVARRGFVVGADAPKLLAELHRLGANADDILTVIRHGNVSPAVGLKALLSAKGVTTQHVRSVLMSEQNVFQALGDAAMRKELRAAAGDLRLQDVLAADSWAFHSEIGANEGLRNWFLESATSSELLWFCTATPALAPKLTRIVGSRQGFDWVRQLTSKPEGHDAELRILAMNCHDAATAKYVRDVLLGESAYQDRTQTTTALPTDARSRGGERERLDEALAQGDSSEVLARLNDLDDPERAQLGRDDALVMVIGHSLDPYQWARAARYLDLTFSRTIEGSPGRNAMTVAHLDRRPHAEQLEALARPELVTRAAAKVHANLLAVFSALYEPATLAAVLARDHGVLRLLIAGSDPDLVVDLISKPQVIATARKVLEAHPQMYKELPKFKDMTADGKAGVDRIGKDAPEDSQIGYWTEDVKSGDVETTEPAKARGKRLHAVETKTLVEAIGALGEKHDKVDKAITTEKHGTAKWDALDAEQQVSEVDALSVLRQHKAEVPALLTDRLQSKLVDKIVALIDLPPNIAIPWIDRAELIVMPNAQRWWMAFKDPSALLHEIGGNAHARAQICGAMNAGTGGVREWMGRMYKGGRLDAAEEQTLDQMRPLVRDPDALRALFLVRFGMPTPTDYDMKTLDRLYEICSRLPAGQIQQERIQMFSNPDLAGQNAAGMYGEGHGDVEIDDDLHPGKDTKDFYTDDMMGWHTPDAMMRIYGYDDAKLVELAGQKRIEAKVDKGPMLYRLKSESIDFFTQVVLHEIGHSVDEMLGKRSAPVFEFAGWHEYSDATFDKWAAEMGGWEHVSADDRAKIQRVWIDATRGKTTVRSLVADDHPALSESYAKKGVGLVQSARKDHTFDHEERIEHDGRIFIAGSTVDQWCSVKAEAAKTAPSAISLYAPAECFAESYVEYYHGVDGSPGSSGNKGGALPGPVKQWFDANVDSIKFDPARFKGGASDKPAVDAVANKVADAGPQQTSKT